MMKEKYLQELQNKVISFNKGKNYRFFVFGSSVRNGRFGDCDVGVMGGVSRAELRRLKEEFEKSNFPYFVDIVNFDEVSEEFRNNVLNDKIIWLTPNKYFADELFEKIGGSYNDLLNKIYAILK